LCKLLAPIMPFIAEEIYQNLVRSAMPEAEESIHLSAFPVADESRIDAALAEDTRLVMKIASLGRAARSKATIKVRQPLPSILVKTRSRAEQEGVSRLAQQLIEELNVKAIDFTTEDSESLEKKGLSVVAEGDYAVAVSTQIPQDLIEEGLAREVVHRLQNMRKSAGFEIADYIITYYSAEAPLKTAIRNQSGYIQQETLSRQLLEQMPEQGVFTEKSRIDGHELTLGVQKVEG